MIGFRVKEKRDDDPKGGGGGGKSGGNGSGRQGGSGSGRSGGGPSGRGPSGGGGPGGRPPGAGGARPAPFSNILRVLQMHSFKAAIRMTGLADSYNRCHPDAPINPRGAFSGMRIGGIGQEVGLIEGLKNSMNDLLDDSQLLALPVRGEELLFSDGELQQIMRELAYGIFAHDTVPFFSLHFNENGSMFPVLHPAYQNTLVGRIFGLLDYQMKGFLNGGIFSEEFLDAWQKNPSLDTEWLNGQLIDLGEYCKEHLPSQRPYRSLREIMALYELKEFGAEEQVGEKIVRKPRFRTSFRIIARQNGVQNLASLLTGKGDFRVEYTIDGTPEYDRYRREYRQQHGEEPAEFRQLNQIYREVAEDIRNLLPQLPMAAKYVQLLGVINFLSHYFKTLKSMQKAPIFPEEQELAPFRCPTLFPPLPVRQVKIQREIISLRALLDRLNVGERIDFKEWINRRVEGEAEEHSHLRNRLQLISGQLISEQAPLQNEELNQKLDELLESLVKQLIEAKYSLEKFRKQMEEESKKVQEQVDHLSCQMRLQRQTIEKLNLEERQILQKLHEESQKALTQMQKAREENLQKNLNELRKKVNETRASLSYRSRIDMDEVERIEWEIKKKVNEHWDAEEQRVKKEVEEKRKQIANGFAADRNKMEQRHREMERGKRELEQQREKWKKQPEEESRKLSGWIYSKEMENLRLEFVWPKMETKVLSVEEQRKEREEGSMLILGGCGMEWRSQRLQPLSIGGALAHEALEATFSSEPLRMVHAEGQSYALFPVPFVRYEATGNREFEFLAPDRGEIDPVCQKLFEAILNGDLEGIREILREGVDLQGCDEQGRGALHYAVQSGNEEIVRGFLRRGLSPLQKDSLGMTPFHLAAAAGGVVLLQLLYWQDRSTIDLLDHQHSSALYLAAQEGRVEVVDKLIVWGADLNRPIHNGLFPLLIALQNKHDQVALELLRSPRLEVNQRLEDGTCALHLAVERKAESVVEALIRRRADLCAQRQDGMSALHLAAREGQVELAIALVRANSATLKVCTAEGLTPLHLAAAQGGVKVVEALMELRADVAVQSSEGKTPLMLAIEVGDLQSAALLAKQTPPNIRNAEGNGALHLAGQLNFFDLGKILWRGGERAGELDSMGWSYLHYLARAGCDLRMRSILQEYPNLKGVCTSKGESLMEIALRWGQDTVVEFLTRVGAEPPAWEVPDASGWAPIHHFARFFNPASMREFIEERGEARFPIERGEDAGKTLGYIAAESGQLDNLGVILEESEPSDHSWRGRSLLYAAVRGGHTHCVYYLMKHYPLNICQIADEENQLYPIYVALGQADLPMISCLEDCRASMHLLDERGESVFEYAVKHRLTKIQRYFFEDVTLKVDEKVMKALLQSGDIKQIERFFQQHRAALPLLKKWSFHYLLEALSGGRREVALWILRTAGPIEKIDASRPEGEAPLLHQILERGVLPNLATEWIDQYSYLPDWQGESPLCPAVRAGDWESVLQLIGRGVNPDSCSGADNRPLMQLALHGEGVTLREEQRQIVEALSKGEQAEVKRRLKREEIDTLLPFDGRKMTALQIALFCKQRELANHLLERGADWQRRDSTGCSALEQVILFGDDLYLRSSLQRCAIDCSSYKNASVPLLTLALIRDSLPMVEILLEWGASPYEESLETGITPFFHAIVEQKVEFVDFFLKRCGEEIALQPNSQHLTPLYVAAEGGNRVIIEKLLKAGASIHEPATELKRTPLFAAVAGEAPSIVRLLLTHGARANLSDLEGQTPLHLAMQGKSTEIIRLLSHQPKVKLNAENREGMRPVHLAALQKNTQGIKLLAEQGADLSSGIPHTIHEEKEGGKRIHQLTPLHIAAEQGDLQSLQLLRQEGADIYVKRGEWGLCSHAARSGNKKMIKAVRKTILVEDSQDWKRAVVQATSVNATSLLKYLSKRGLSLDGPLPDGWTALHEACSARSSQSLTLLLSELSFDEEIHPLNLRNRAPIQEAVLRGNLNELRQLIELGADPDLVDSEGQTLLHLAIGANQPTLVAYLIYMGADLQKRDGQGKSPIQQAIGNDRWTCLSYLLYSGAYEDQTHLIEESSHSAMQQRVRTFFAVRASGEGLLHTAYRLNEREVVPFLSIDPEHFDEKNREGETTLELARREQNREWIHLLTSYQHAL